MSSAPPPDESPAGAPLPDDEALGLYFHWPFCLSKCPYCDFNSHVRDSIDMEEWKRAMLLALRWFAGRAGGRRVVSLFFGGGTPSLMEPSLVSALIDEAARLWPFARDVEITMEANPGSAEAARFGDFAAAGVNRLSLGIQALDDAALKLLGRAHDTRQALAAWDMASASFPRASFDLIYARPGQRPGQWEAELEQALKLGSRHISAYQLTMEPETPFYRLHERGRLKLPDDEQSLAMYRLTRDMLAASGLACYEVSNYAAKGEECRHNLLYWNYGLYAGIGPGAHSRLIGDGGGRLALAAWRAPRRWLAAAREGGIETSEPLTPRQAGMEYLLMGLRARCGVSLERYRKISGEQLGKTAIRRLCAQGLMEVRGGRIRATPRGMELLGQLLVELVG